MALQKRLVLAALLLAAFVVVLGAYVRLSDAGLGCPDWPGCYGHLAVPEQMHEQAAAAAAFPGKPIQAAKAWKEMVHRYCAATLGLLILAIAVLAWRRRTPGRLPWVETALVGVVAFQGALGMWTVTLLLKPVIVSAHLLGGLTTLSLLLWLALPKPRVPDFRTLRLPAFLLLLGVAGQIALGGWTSSNYAAMACGEFPTCLGKWMPEMDFQHAFQFHRELGMTADGELLSLPALAAIHWSHRLGALLTALAAGFLALVCLRRRPLRAWGFALLGALVLQVALGIGNVVMGLPLPLAVAHNAGAALLLAAVVALNRRLWPG